MADPATWAVIGSSALGAYSANQQSRALNKKRTTYTDQTQHTSPWGPTQPFLNFGLDQSLLNFMRPVDPFPELPQLRAGGGLGANAKALIDRLQGGGSGFLSLGRGFIKDLLEGDVGENPYLQELMDDFQRESAETYRESTVPFTRSQYALGGHVASGLAEAGLARANEEYNESVQAGINQLLAQAFSENLGAQVAAANALPAYHSASLQGPMAALQALVAENATRAPLQLQAQLADRDLALQQFFYNSQAPDRRLSQFLGNILPIAGLGGTTSLSGTNVVPGAGIDTGGASLAGALGGLFSGYNNFGGGKQQQTPQPSAPLGIPGGGFYPFSFF